MSKKINVLVIGSGGREHAIAFQLKNSRSVGEIFVSPGNGGTELDCVNVPLSITPPFKELISFIKEKEIGLVMVGSEDYLAMGIVDALTKKGINIFGPSKKASQLETSKAFSKKIMKEAGVPTASYKVFTNIASAKKYISSKKGNFVLKADGLCAGKGVIIPKSKEEALVALEDYFIKEKFGKAGKKVLVEDFLTGQEASILAFSDGETVRLLPPSQDYKRIFDNDQGPNTGGMGNYTPLPFLKKQHLEKIKKNILLPILKTMKEKGCPFKGILYAGLMMDSDDIQVVEFNVRFGDPECQCVLPLLKTDLAKVCLACIDGSLGKITYRVKNLAACTVVLASKGYPGEYEVGKKITSLPNMEKEQVEGMLFHAGTKMQNNEIVTAGGRVLAITTYADSLKNAITECYRQVKKVKCSNLYYRKDIGKKGL